MQPRAAGELPAGAQVLLVGLSVRAWNAANPGPAWVEEVRVRLHWHTGPLGFLAGDHHAGYWRGPAGCPPECPGHQAAADLVGGDP